MEYSVYDVSIPPSIQILQTLDSVLKTGETSPNASRLLQAQLHHDMKPLRFHAWAVVDASLKLYARVSSETIPPFPDDIESFADVYARIDHVIKMLSECDRAKINGPKPEEVSAGIAPGRAVQIPFSVYVHTYAMPNMFFHLTTVYNILRKEDVPLGKRDFFKSFLGGYLPEE